ncbi:sulfotransferase 2A1-like [Notamacropus eugenii]|uniref:sulfotransferase 2A1-like n=1 Tax=Notamacropus eugenii TaxID=9315 RepID=UPI003B679F0B
MENSKEFMFLKGIPLLPTVHNVKFIERLQDDFEVRDKDIIIITYPKSGTHWMIEILSLIYSKGDPTWVKSVPFWKRSPWIEGHTEVVKNKADPRLLTSHLPICLFPKSYFSSKAKIIYVARNPRDVLISAYYFGNQISQFQPCLDFEHFFESFVQGNVVFGSWFDHVRGWLSMKNSEKFLLLTYEELHQDLKTSVDKICQFLGMELSEEEISSVIQNASFQAMKNHILENNEAIPIENVEPFKIMIMRKGICGDWKNYFTVTQMETFNQLYQEKMKGLDQDLFPWDQC